MAIGDVSELDELVHAARAAITRIHKTLPGVPVSEIVEFAGAVPSRLSVTLDLSTSLESTPTTPMALVIVRQRAGAATILDGLTPRQLEVARFMARGWSNDQIAGALGIAIGTTKDHVHAVLRRTGCRTRAGFVAALSGTDGNHA